MAGPSRVRFTADAFYAAMLSCRDAIGCEMDEVYRQRPACSARRLFRDAAPIHNEIGWIVVNPDTVNGPRTTIRNRGVLGFVGALGPGITGKLRMGARRR